MNYENDPVMDYQIDNEEHTETKNELEEKINQPTINEPLDIQINDKLNDLLVNDKMFVADESMPTIIHGLEDLNVKLSRLHCLEHRLVKESGINRSLGLEAMSVIEDFKFNSPYYFTLTTSQANYTYTLESTKESIKNFSEKVLELIKKLWDFIIGLFRKDSLDVTKVSESINKNIKTEKKIIEKFKPVYDNMLSFDKPLNDGNPKISNLEDLLKWISKTDERANHIINKFFLEPQNVINDLMNESKILHCCNNISSNLNETYTYLNTLIDKYFHYVKNENMGSDSNLINKLSNELEELLEDKNIYVPSQAYLNCIKISNIVNNEEPREYQSLADCFIFYYNKLINKEGNDFIKILSEIELNLSKNKSKSLTMKKTLDLAKTEFNKMNEHEIDSESISKSGKFFEKISKELNQLSLLIDRFKIYSESICIIYQTYINFIFDISKIMKKNKNMDWNEEGEKLILKLSMLG